MNSKILVLLEADEEVKEVSYEQADLFDLEDGEE